jgi:hypothetical protein
LSSLVFLWKGMLYKQEPVIDFQWNYIFCGHLLLEGNCLAISILLSRDEMDQIPYTCFMLDNSTYLILTLNINIYYNRCVTTYVITSCTLIVPCLIPVYVL